MKDESASDFNTPCFEPGSQWSDVECSTAQPSAPHSRIKKTSITARPVESVLKKPNYTCLYFGMPFVQADTHTCIVSSLLLHVLYPYTLVNQVTEATTRITMNQQSLAHSEIN